MVKSKKNQIVIVDDDDDLLRLLSHAFKSKGFEVKTLSTGKKASKFFSDDKNMESIALIILDRILPDRDGLDILVELRNQYTRKTPVLILSILSSEKDVVSGLKKGAVEYMAKPFSLPVLMEKALSLMKKS